MNSEIFEEMRQQNKSKTIYKQAVEYAFNYLDNLYDRNVFPSKEALDRLDIFNESLPQQIPGRLRHIKDVA